MTRPPWLPLGVAAVLVPAALAAVTLAWPGQQLEAQVSAAAPAALAAAGIPFTGVTVDGRDAVVAGVPLGQRDRAATALDKAGAGTVTFTGDGAAPAPAVPPTTAPTTPPASPPPTAALDPAAKQALQAEIDQALATTPIRFAPDSATLTPEGRSAVQQVLTLLLARPAARVQIDGFVAAGPGDGVLSAQELSERRAVAVRDILVAGGIPADATSVRGLGEGAVPTRDAAGRRVEITVG